VARIGQILGLEANFGKSKSHDACSPRKLWIIVVAPEFGEIGVVAHANDHAARVICCG
jgi:hypothetical protein